jgi:hypothetical protein
VAPRGGRKIDVAVYRQHLPNCGDIEGEFGWTWIARGQMAQNVPGGTRHVRFILIVHPG